MILTVTIFWVSFGLILATYVLYPLAMHVLARGCRAETYPSIQDEWPTVTLIIAAFNEEDVIREKMENSLALDYPHAKLEVMVVSDESTDSTDSIVREYAERGVVLQRMAPRKGKSAGLTQSVPQATGNILVFSDANSMYDKRAIRYLVAAFSDSHVGYVVGRQKYVNETESNVSQAENFYWNIELGVKEGESRFGSVVGGDGAIFALRKDLFESLRDDDLSDFVTPLRIIAKGFKGVFEPHAICVEKTAVDYGGEFRRKVRIVNRAFRTVLRVPQALNPFKVGWFAFQLFFHKVVRWFVPYLLLLCLFTSSVLSLAEIGVIYQAALGAQLLFYTMAVLYGLNILSKVRIVSIAYYFCLGNVAALLGTMGVILGRRITMWKPERG